VEVDSTPGAGSTFRVYLPTAPAPEEDDSPHRPDDAGSADPRPATVLVVEDEEAVRRFVHQVLRPAGHRLLEAADGDEAQRLARRTRDLDLLLCDLVLPGLDGREVAARVREYHPHARVLFMSGYSDEELALRQHQRPEDLLEKPFTPAELVARLGRALRLPAGVGG
jgi:CheY-like chemotaxis protein